MIPHRNCLSGSSKCLQPSAITFLAGFEEISAFLRTEGSSPGVVPDETKLSATDRAALRCTMLKMTIMPTVEHFSPPVDSRE
jgi:hypothetical protein